MGDNAFTNRSRGAFLCVAAMGVALAGPPATTPAAGGDAGGLRIGIIGAGRIGGTLGELRAKAVHEVLLSSRHPERLHELAQRLGPKARAGTPLSPAAFGEVVLLSVP